MRARPCEERDEREACTTVARVRCDDRSTTEGAVLIVEDDADVREAVCELLEEEGFCTWSAANGREALSLLGNAGKLPRVILLDLMMPIMNGWELTEHLRGDPASQSIPIIVMTAQGNYPTLDDVLILRKPLDVDVLVAAIRSAFDHSFSRAKAGAMAESKQTILVVENEPDLQEVLRALLMRERVEVACAADGEEALAYLAHHLPPEVIVLDLHMPKMDGFAFRARQLKDARICNVPVVFLTAIEGIPAQRDDQRAVCCLKKPFDPEELVAVVSRYLTESVGTRS